MVRSQLLAPIIAYITQLAEYPALTRKVVGSLPTVCTKQFERLIVARSSKVSDEALADAVAQSISVMEVLRRLGIKEAGGSHSHCTKRIKKLGLDTKHFLGAAHNRGKLSPRRTKPEDILVLRESGGRAKSAKLVRALIESEVKHECALCSQPPFWRGFKLTLDVDHINENWLDDRKENLRFLCPNCHSQFSRNLLGS